MKIHGIRPELQPEVVNEKARLAQEANAKADKPVRGHENVEPPTKKTEEQSSRLLDVKG